MEVGIAVHKATDFVQPAASLHGWCCSAIKTRTGNNRAILEGLITLSQMKFKAKKLHRVAFMKEKLHDRVKWHTNGKEESVNSLGRWYTAYCKLSENSQGVEIQEEAEKGLKAILINVYKFPLDNFHLQYPSNIIHSSEILIFTHINLYMTVHTYTWTCG